MAEATEGFPAFCDGSALCLRLAIDGRSGQHAACFGDAGARSLGARGQSDGGNIDTLSVKTTEASVPRGYDAGKKVKGRKRGLVTDTIGLPVALPTFGDVHPANIQDRDGQASLLDGLRKRWPWRRHAFADGGHAGEKLVEWTLAWSSRNRRLAKDFEASLESASAWAATGVHQATYATVGENLIHSLDVESGS